MASVIHIVLEDEPATDGHEIPCGLAATGESVGVARAGGFDGGKKQAVRQVA